MNESFEIELDLKKPIKTSFDKTESLITKIVTKYKNGEDVSNESIKKASILYREAKRAREKLILNNLYLIDIAVAKHKNQLINSYDSEDLVSAGNVAIVNLSRFFDFSTGFKFTTYAYNGIENAVIQEKNALNSEFSISDNDSKNIRRIVAASNRYKSEHRGKLPNNNTLSNMTGLSERVITKYLQIMNQTSKIIKIDDAGNQKEFDYFQTGLKNQAHNKLAQPDKKLITKESNQILADMLNKLSPREGLVVALINGLVDGERYSYAQIGKRLGISKQRVGAIAQSAYKKMRAMLKTNGST